MEQDVQDMGGRQAHEPLRFGELLKEFLLSNQPLAVAIRAHINHMKMMKQQMPPDMSMWMDNAELMQKIHVSLRTLQNWRRDGKLPYTKVGGRVHYLRTDVEAFMQEGYTRKEGKR